MNNTKTQLKPNKNIQVYTYKAHDMMLNEEKQHNESS